MGVPLQRSTTLSLPQHSSIWKPSGVLDPLIFSLSYVLFLENREFNFTVMFISDRSSSPWQKTMQLSSLHSTDDIKAWLSLNFLNLNKKLRCYVIWTELLPSLPVDLGLLPFYVRDFVTYIRIKSVPIFKFEKHQKFLPTSPKSNDKPILA